MQSDKGREGDETDKPQLFLKKFGHRRIAAQGGAGVDGLHRRVVDGGCSGAAQRHRVPPLARAPPDLAARVVRRADTSWGNRAPPLLVGELPIGLRHGPIGDISVQRSRGECESPPVFALIDPILRISTQSDTHKIPPNRPAFGAQTVTQQTL